MEARVGKRPRSAARERVSLERLVGLVRQGGLASSSPEPA
ncbi:MAG: hypothetical protein V7644_1299 [Actinomycetota bacterium]|jgi:hypothetical protein